MGIVHGGCSESASQIYHTCVLDRISITNISRVSTKVIVKIMMEKHISIDKYSGFNF
jgi:hypothetical protein